MNMLSGSGNAALARMAAFEAVSFLKARYFRFMDMKRWDVWEDLFTSRAVMDMSGEAAAMAELGMDVGDGADWVLHSASTIRKSVEAAMSGVTSAHQGHMAELEMVEPTRVRAIWAMEDVLRYPPGGALAGFHGYGHYHDVYVYDRGRWLIENVTLKRLMITPVFNPALQTAAE
jgi:hypothetical protein